MGPEILCAAVAIVSFIAGAMVHRAGVQFGIAQRQEEDRQEKARLLRQIQHLKTRREMLKGLDPFPFLSPITPEQQREELKRSNGANETIELTAKAMNMDPLAYEVHRQYEAAYIHKDSLGLA
jgi:hypothetical protein